MPNYRHAWELTPSEYFKAMTHSKWEQDGLCPVYFVQGFPKQTLNYRMAADLLFYGREVGQFCVICRQILRTGKLHPYLRADLFVFYAPQFRKFFRDHPELQTGEAVTL